MSFNIGTQNAKTIINTDKNRIVELEQQVLDLETALKISIETRNRLLEENKIMETMINKLNNQIDCIR